MKNKKLNHSDEVICHYDIIERMPIVGTRQALDNGWNVRILSNNPNFRDHYRTCKSDIGAMIPEKFTVIGYYCVCEPDDDKYMHLRSRVIYLEGTLSLRALLDVVVHEVSHVVDSMFDQINLETVDTELRAYLMDYYCGHIFDMIDFSTGTYMPKFLKTKNVNKLDKLLATATKLRNKFLKEEQ